jgi:LysR family transcriptional regulator, pca operon transcriptional activator
MAPWALQMVHDFLPYNHCHRFYDWKTKNFGIIHNKMSMNHAIKLRHIRLFLEIADRGNLSAAAQSLGLSQPALSKSLAETELLLGGALFLRQGRRLILTAAGDAFRRHIRAAMIHLDNAATVFAPEKPQGRISVGVLPTVSTQFFPQVAAQFLTASPQVTLAIESGPHDYLLQKLREGWHD